MSGMQSLTDMASNVEVDNASLPTGTFELKGSSQGIQHNLQEFFSSCIFLKSYFSSDDALW